MSRFIVTGTDTGIGKTVVSAMLVAGLGAHYWKPIQSGTADGTDSQRVTQLSGASDAQILPEAYCFSQPLSPHRAAELDGIKIDLDALEVPSVPGPLIIEGAGGLLVPVTRHTLQIELFAGWDLPVILCASTRLGTINHTLMSLAVLQDWELPIHGIIFVGEENADNQRTIVEMGGVDSLGRLPHLDPLTPETLRTAFAAEFSRDAFQYEAF